MKRILVLLVTFCSTLLHGEECSYPLSSLFARASYHFGESLLTDEPYMRYGVAYFPNLCRCRWGVLGQADLYQLDAGNWASSTGLGVRVLDPKLYWVWGANAFYDYLETDFGSLNRMAFGIEVITPCLGLNVNYYQPLGSGRVTGPSTLFDDYIGNYNCTISGEISLYRGFDFLFSKYVPLRCNFFLYGGLGGYYLDDFFDMEAWGFQARGELWWLSFAYLGIYFTHDQIFGPLTEGYVGISLPLDRIAAWIGLGRSGCCERRCDPGNYTNGWNGRGARIHHMGGPGTMRSCCRYTINSF